MLVYFLTDFFTKSYYDDAKFREIKTACTVVCNDKALKQTNIELTDDDDTTVVYMSDVRLL